MATLIKNGNNYGNYYQEWQIKDESELADLWQAKPGSVAYTNNPQDGALSKIWMLDNEGHWNEI